MRTVWVLSTALLFIGCVSFYRSYDYHVYRVSDDLCYASVFFWGQQFVPGWEEKAQEAARRMLTAEAAKHQLSGEITIDGKPQPSEMGGISVNAFIGRKVSMEEGERIKKSIDYRSPIHRGKAKLPQPK